MENSWDKKLKIRTTGRDASMEDKHHYPYEPTPYSVLERLAESGYIEEDNVLLDYGCGMGRVSFFLHHQIGCRTIGIEYDEKIFQKLKENEESYIGKKQNLSETTFYQANAEDFVIPDADCFFFFNPFSVKILQSVMGRILDSYYGNPREMKMFFYYPNEEYISYLMTAPELLFLDEIDCMDLFEGENEREKILIFEVI